MVSGASLQPPSQRGTTKTTLEEKLRGKRFARCNSCYLVNLAYVDTVKGYQLLLKDGTELQISQPKKKSFMQALKDSQAQG